MNPPRFIVSNSHSNLDRKFVPRCYSPNFIFEIPHGSIPMTHEHTLKRCCWHYILFNIYHILPTKKKPFELRVFWDNYE